MKFNFNKLSKVNKLLLAIVVMVIIGFAAFVIAIQPYRAEPYRLDDAYQVEGVEITESGRYFSIDNSEEQEIGMVFYIGGLVEEEAYLYKLAMISQETGIDIFTPKYLIKLPIISPNKGDDILEEHDYDQWIVGGHSLGGVVACMFTEGNDEVDVLLLLASYCNEELSNVGTKVVSIYGSEDRIINIDSFKESNDNLPEDAIILELYGANHSDFGNYGIQEGDGESLVTDDDIVEEVSEVLITILEQ